MLNDSYKKTAGRREFPEDNWRENLIVTDPLFKYSKVYLDWLASCVVVVGTFFRLTFEMRSSEMEIKINVEKRWENVSPTGPSSDQL